MSCMQCSSHTFLVYFIMTEAKDIMRKNVIERIIPLDFSPLWITLQIRNLVTTTINLAVDI